MHILILMFCISQIFLFSSIASVDAIIGGYNASNDQFTYQVSIQVNKKHVCGGAIISDRHVLTAAHCVIDEKENFENSIFLVLAGISDLSMIKKGMVLEVEKIYIPKEFKFNQYISQIKGDLALLKLRNRLQFDRHTALKKLKLPKKSDNYLTYENEQPIVTGFGSTYVEVCTNCLGREVIKESPTSNKLKYIETQITSLSSCAWLKLDKFHLCAQAKQHDRHSPEGVCSGDSGGPLVLNQDTVIGILSVGPPKCNERYESGIYTKISSYLDFILKSMNDEKTADNRIATYRRISYGLFGSKLILEESPSV